MNDVELKDRPDAFLTSVWATTNLPLLPALKAHCFMWSHGMKADLLLLLILQDVEGNRWEAENNVSNGSTALPLNIFEATDADEKHHGSPNLKRTDNRERRRSQRSTLLAVMSFTSLHLG